MLAQRTLLQQDNREAGVGAAPQHDFRKPVVEPGRISRNLNRPFAARSTNWKDADETDFRFDGIKVCWESAHLLRDQETGCAGLLRLPRHCQFGGVSKPCWCVDVKRAAA